MTSPGTSGNIPQRDETSSMTEIGAGRDKAETSSSLLEGLLQDQRRKWRSGQPLRANFAR